MRFLNHYNIYHTSQPDLSATRLDTAPSLNGAVWHLTNNHVWWLNSSQWWPLPQSKDFLAMVFSWLAMTSAGLIHAYWCPDPNSYLMNRKWNKVAVWWSQQLPISWAALDSHNSDPGLGLEESRITLVHAWHAFKSYPSLNSNPFLLSLIRSCHSHCAPTPCLLIHRVLWESICYSQPTPCLEHRPSGGSPPTHLHSVVSVYPIRILLWPTMCWTSRPSFSRPASPKVLTTLLLSLLAEAKCHVLTTLPSSIFNSRPLSQFPIDCVSCLSVAGTKYPDSKKEMVCDGLELQRAIVHCDGQAMITGWEVMATEAGGWSHCI